MSGYHRAVVAWVRFVVSRPWLTLLLVGLSVVCAGAYAATHIRMNSDTSTLVHQDAPFRRRYRELNRIFPHYDRTIIAVVSAETHRKAAKGARRLAEALRQREDLFWSVFSTDENDFFEDNGFLYLDVDDLDRVVSRLAEAQPVLTALARDPSLRGLFQELSNAVEALERGEDVPVAFERLADRISEVSERRLAGERLAVDWEEEFLVDDPGYVHHLVTLQGREDFSSAVSTEVLISTIRQTAADLGLVEAQGFRVRLTGMVPLAYEEMASVQESLGLASAVSFILLASIMTFGARSLRVIVSSLVTVVVGIVWTAAFAMASVGEFNIISAAFSVLLTGLGVDFAIHFCLRVQEGLIEGLEIDRSAKRAADGLATALTLCALTSAIGFLSFAPTNYRGLAELGIIAGGGMFLALLACFTVTPALLVAMGTPRGRPANLAFPAGYAAFLSRRGGWVGVLALTLGALAAGVASRMTFDFSTLALKNPNGEAMTTLRDLTKEGIVTDYTITLLADDLAAARRLAGELKSLSLVKDVRTPEDYLPEDQDRKLEMLEDAELFLWPAFRAQEAMPAPSDAERVAIVEGFRNELAAIPKGAPASVARACRRLEGALTGLLTSADREAVLADVERLVIGNMQERIEWLETVLGRDAIGLDDLPSNLRARLISEEGVVLVSATPTEDVSRVDALKRFIDAVGAVSSKVTGQPVVEAGVGAIVVQSFYQAIAISLIAVLLVVYLSLRDVVDTLLVLAPIALSAVTTMAIAVLIDTRFNMANIIVIPLVLGLGVDNGIHIVLRHREEGALAPVLASSTPRAIILSCLTTLGAFGAIGVSDHMGLRSMGILLSIAVSMLLASTLVVLPALLAWRSGGEVVAEWPVSSTERGPAVEP